jgi:hypothetical protein
MTYLKLRLNDSVRNSIPRFEQFLQTLGIYVAERTENEQENTIELVTTAHIFPEIRHLTNLAFDFFGEFFIGLYIKYKTKETKKKNKKSMKSKGASL